MVSIVSRVWKPDEALALVLLQHGVDGKHYMCENAFYELSRPGVDRASEIADE